MPFDGYLARGLTDELKNTLVGGRINRVFQPFEQEIHLVIRANGKTHRLNASIHPTYYRIQLTNERPNNPKDASMFCRLLRKYLENSIIVDIRQYQNDRIIDFEIRGRDELGDLKTYYLIFELMGRNSNIILVDSENGKILDCIKHVPAELNRFRTLLATSDYQRPPHNANQTNLWSLTDNELTLWCQENKDSLIDGNSFRFIQGLSKITAKKISDWIKIDNLSCIEAIEHLHTHTLNPIPSIFYNQNKSLDYYLFDLSDDVLNTQVFDSLSLALDVFYEQKVRLDRIQQLTGDLIHRVTQIINKNNQKLLKLDKDRQIASEANLYKLKGELLNAYVYQLDDYQTEVEVQNYYQNNEPITIKLNSSKTIIENSQDYYRKYTKYRDSLKYITNQEKLTNEENNYLESILVQLREADIEDIEEIKNELKSEGYGFKQKQNIKKRAINKSKPRRFISSDGDVILVGRNNRQNDQLSMKSSNKNHYWLHTKDIPGSHVIIQSTNPSEKTILEAAEIAAYYSKSQQSSNVPVDMVQVRHLRKPNGAKPGYVIYEGQETVFVTPEAQTIKSLSAEE